MMWVNCLGSSLQHERFQTLPDAITDGDSRHAALYEMVDALGAALAQYSLSDRAIPAPSLPVAGENLVPVNALVAAKLALRAAMKEQGVSNVRLGEVLGLSEGAIRRLVDPDHPSRLDGVVAALAALGRCLVVEDQAA